MGAAQQGDPDYEFLERRLGDLCQHDCYTAVEQITDELASMNCNLQFETIKQGLQMIAMLGGSSISTAQIDQATAGIDSLIAEGITEVTHDEFQQLHDLTHQSCAEIAAPPGSANATTTCAGEFMALQSVNSSMHLTVCSGIDDSCITLASGFANMYNGMATDLCPNHADQLAALCNQTHTAQSVISELSGTSSSSPTPLGKMLPWSLLFLMSA